MNAELFTVGNYTDIPQAENLCTHTGQNTIVFVGKMDYEPNIVATTWFAREVFPALLKDNPELKFYIVGAYPHPRVYRLAQENKNIIVTGRVESIEPYFQTLTIFIAPMLTGAGIQNKIIQAMSYSCCVATTPTGAEGLNISDGEIAIWKGKEQWTEGIRRLLDSTSTRIEMGIKARQYVISNLSVESVEKDFWEFFDL